MSRKKLILFFLAFLASCTAAADTSSFLMELMFITKKCDKECIFRPTRLSSESMGSFPTNCSTVCSQLVIDEKTDLSEKQLTSVFENMKILVGGLSVMFTNHTSGKYLAGLEQIDCGIGQKMEWSVNTKMTELGLTSLTNITCPNIQISDNSKMTKLNLPNFKNYTSSGLLSSSQVSISNLAPSFCITGDELKALLLNKAPDNMNLVAKFCEPTTSDNSKSCTKLTEECVDFYGDLVVGPSYSTASLKSIESIFGGLTINGTNFSNFDAFENLKYIGQLDKKKAAISVVGNKNLTSFLFPNLKKIFSNSLEAIVFKNNSKVLITDPMSCYRLRSTVIQASPIIPDFDGESCEDMKVVNSPSTGTVSATTVSSHPGVTQKSEPHKNFASGLVEWKLFACYFFLCYLLK